MFVLLYIYAAVFSRPYTWWNWLWILGKSQWWSICVAHQYFHSGQGKQRAAILSLVWSFKKLPHLLRHLETPTHNVSMPKYPFLGNKVTPWYIMKNNARLPNLFAKWLINTSTTLWTKFVNKLTSTYFDSVVLIPRVQDLAGRIP